MQKFLTKKLEETFGLITMDYTYKYARHFEDKIKRGLYSTSDKFHYRIMLDFMENELIPYDGIAQAYFLNQDILKGANRLAELGDMIFHNSYGIHVLYCPEKLTEYQQLRLRLWYEYFKIVKMEYEISTQERNVYENKDLRNYLQENRILDEEYIQSLTLKYPDYKD